MAEGSQAEEGVPEGSHRLLRRLPGAVGEDDGTARQRHGEADTSGQEGEKKERNRRTSHQGRWSVHVQDERSVHPR